MNRLISISEAILVTLLCLMPLQARAQNGATAEHHDVGIGFHSTDAPLGVRWWLAEQKVGIDLGFGYFSEESSSYPDERLSTWAVDVGVPIVLKSWPRVHVLLRPGLLYESAQVEATVPPVPFDTDNDKLIVLSAEIEGEAFLLENFSVSASTGLAWESFDPAVGDKDTSFATIGNNFTNVGFHIYLFH